MKYWRFFNVAILCLILLATCSLIIVGILGHWPKWGDPESWSYVPTVPELYDFLMLNTLLGIPLSLIGFFSGSAKILRDLAKRLGFKSLYLEIILVSTSVLYLFDPSGLILWVLD